MKRAGLRSSAIATLAGVVLILVALLVSGSLAARILGPADRGYFALLVLVPSLVCQIAGLGISLSVTHFVAAREISGVEALQRLRRPLLLQSVVATLGALALGALLNIGHPNYVVVGVLIASSFVVTTYAKEYSLGLLQASGRSVTANLLKAAPPVAGAVGMTVLYVLGVSSLTTVMLTYAAAEWSMSFVLIGVTAAALRHDEANAPATTDLSAERMLQFGRAGYFSYMSPLDSFRLDQIFVGAALSAASLGYYAAGAAFTTIPRAIALGVGLTAAPFIAQQRGREGRSARRPALIFGAIAIGLSALTAAVVGGSAGWLVPTLFGEAFSPAIPITRILMVGGFLFAVRRILIDILRGAGNPGAGLRSEVAGLVVFGVAVVPLSQWDGAVGVAWAFTLAAAVNVGSLAVRERHLAKRVFGR